MELNTNHTVCTEWFYRNHVHRICIKVKDKLINNPYQNFGLYINNYDLDPIIKPSVNYSNSLSKLDLFVIQDKNNEEIVDEILTTLNKN